MTSRKPSQRNPPPASHIFRDRLQREAGKQLHSKQTPRVPAPDLHAWLARLETAEPRQLGRLELIPLCLNEIGPASQVVLSDAAIQAGWLQIGEQGEGVVQEVVAFNRGRDPVLILEGDTLIGCKQNRVVAHSVIVAPASAVVIPVGCVEQGRWAHTSQLFRSGDLRMEPSVRRGAVSETARSRRSGAGPRLDQGRLWSQVSERMLADEVASATDDYHTLLEARAGEARRRAKLLEPAARQVGILALVRGELLGLELTGHPGAWRAVSERTLPSYLLSAEASSGRSPRARRGSRSATDWLTVLRSAKVLAHPGLGLGVDLEIEGPSLAGAGLWFENGPAHLAVFDSATC